ncbi:MAG: inosine/xanthosine triphosphatase [Patescibacteria group bacterium]|nr:inosine/xanthosine triphosphatase [Patescibacteria group bacterium]
MKVIIGTKNEAKVEALRETLRGYELFGDFSLKAIEVCSGVSEQPKTIKETIKGAENRARTAWEKSRGEVDFSFGLESGLMKTAGTKSGYMDTCVCAIFDGKDFCLGFSSCFEYPKKAVKLIFDKGLTVTQAFRELGLSNKARLGREEGAIGILTGGRLTRKGYTKQAIVTALIQVENKGLYGETGRV